MLRTATAIIPLLLIVARFMLLRPAALGGPAQYFAAIVSAQPDGCTHFSGSALERAGNLLEITVYNTVPENRAVVLCTAIYGETASNIPLDIDFEPGETYTLRVNGAEQRFVAQ